MSKFTDFLGAFTRRPRSKPIPVESMGPRIIEVSGSANLTETEKRIVYDDLGCPDCRHGSLYAGPRGGGSRNHRCALCGMGYNLTGGFGDHRIGLPHHLWTAKIKEYRRTLCTLFARHGFRTSEDNWGIVKDNHHGIWIWPHNNFATIPTDDTSLRILTYHQGRSKNVFKWDEYLLQLPDPDFISQLHEALIK